MYFHIPKEREPRELARGVRVRTFWGANLLLSVVEFDPHSEVTKHTHPHEQGGIVLGGELEISIAGESMLLRAGEVYIIPGQVEHWVRSGQSPATLLDIFSPVREDLKY